MCGSLLNSGDLMKISNKFPKLAKENALFLVSGKQSAVIYRLKNGEIHERDTITINKPEYTDREGHFQHSDSMGKFHGSGSVYEPKDAYVHQKFVSELIDEVNRIKKPYDSVYLFAPAHVMNNIEENLPNPVAKKVARKFSGNFTKLHPTELLEKIFKLRDQAKDHIKRSMASGVAAKLLKRTEQAKQGA